MKRPTDWRAVFQVLFAVFFWVFNGSLLVIAYLGLVPFIGTVLIQEALAGQVPLNFFIPFIGLVGVPTTCAIAQLPRLRSQHTQPQPEPQPQPRHTKPPLSLFQFFYSIEAPLLLVCLIRFFWLRDLTPGASFLLLTGLVGTLVYLHQRLSRPASKAETEAIGVRSWLYLAGCTLMLAMALYLATIAAFYLLPFGILMLPELPWMFVYSIILFPLTVIVVGLFTAPFGMVVAYGQAWRTHFNALTSRHRLWAGACVIAVFFTWFGGFLAFQQPPQLHAFQLLEPPAQSQADRQSQVQQSELIRRGLINAYLAPYRYPRTQADEHIYYLYHTSLSLPEGLSRSVQAAYNTLLRPFTYEGNPYEDADKASGLYAQFFDTPILRAERPAIEKAIQSTFDRNGAKAGLADINARRVWLAEQQITVTPQDDWADIEIYEVYENQTFQQEEILYYFSLPESAVITGLWLGETSDRRQRYPFVVAPRGAAQQVYTEEVNRSVDPALLEQVGPRNYRLRAFPIPSLGQGKMHLWLTYKVLKQEMGWPLPDLRERRNLFWTNSTKRLINGKATTAQDAWLPAFLPADADPLLPHQMSLAEDTHVLATPLAAADYQLPSGKRLAIVLDGSYSMTAHQPEIRQTFDWLQRNILTQNTADLYLTAMPPVAPQRSDNLERFDLKQASFYGTLQYREMLHQFLQLRGETDYDAVLVITDPGSYELSTDSATSLSLSAPVWMVHLGGLAFAYDDSTLQAIQASGGGTATQLQEVMQRLGTQPTQGTGTSLLNVVDGYAWFLTANPDASHPTTSGFEALAARQWVTHLTEYVKPDQLAQLDTIHAKTKEYGIVTPYSSMIVLVNDRQRQRLNELEQSDDRFNREVEDQQALPEPSPLSAVPEPAEWLLLILGLTLLGGLYYWQHHRPTQSSEAN